MPSAVEFPQDAQPAGSLPQLEKGAQKAAEGQHKPDIIDIRQAAVETNVKEEIYSLFRPQDGPRKLPTLLLYDEKGLQLFEEITYLEEYYLTNYEIQVLRRSAAAIIRGIPSGCMFIELGSGNLRKVLFLLQALEDAGKEVDYYALDLSKEELDRTLAQLPTFQHVRCHGLLGTYDDGRDWLKTPSIAARPKCILSLGSSIGNFHRDDAASFLKGFADVLQATDRILIGIDSCTNPSKVFHAYNDKEGTTHRFIHNGLRHANEILGEQAFVLDDWEVIGEYVYDSEGGRHQAFYSPIRDTVALGETIHAHERVQIEQSLKYSKEGCVKLWALAGMIEVDRWMTEDEDYGLHLLAKSNMSFSLNPHEYARTNIPPLSDWENLWATWDIVTRGMLPSEELLDQPIKLRNACIFYLGHIPAFLDIQLTKTTKAAPTQPASFQPMFERGIDPDVDNPAHCHKHSEIPEEWPPVDDILDYQDRVRATLRDQYVNGVGEIPRNVGRAIWVGFEHEAMHMETLLYMMLQSEKTLPPPHTSRPDFEALAREAYASRVDNQWFDIPEQEIKLGLDDPEDVLDSKGHFGWDNEKPLRSAHVHSFQAMGRPITNEEYARYVYNTKTAKLPASWSEAEIDHSNGANGSIDGGSNGHTSDGNALPSSFLKGKAVKTVYGLVPLEHALGWPVFASFDELAGCAAWMGGRIPTLEEARSIYTYVDIAKGKQAERKLGKTVPAVNAHLLNDGVEETPPSNPSEAVDGDSSSAKDDLFIDLTGANVGFQHWHPTAVTAHGNRLAGQGEMGGVWEWTSSPLRKHEGFKPMSLYPAYTSDFFDDKHNVVLGGSWATHPRIAGRKSFVNWYQRNYPYAWTGARLVRDK
ncbi:Uu.00g019060.m01.CDS01 [Anthostomella pinea]|uniref:Uu.00g019060.m01.CDS01 n=1 Tax=Anthostomella pinea TaxID=933095 RepID=A0AAI8YNI9_9PEZI|nr:Uu.00g019060.m01.CDS01 [Anthostomella pinea]